MQIEKREVTLPANHLDPVTYVPSHANGNAGHKDCEKGVIMGVNIHTDSVKVLYCKSRTVQLTNPDDLVWG